MLKKEGVHAVYFVRRDIDGFRLYGRIQELVGLILCFGTWDIGD